jgi:hypothetical protein
MNNINNKVVPSVDGVVNIIKSIDTIVNYIINNVYNTTYILLTYNDGFSVTLKIIKTNIIISYKICSFPLKNTTDLIFELNRLANPTKRQNIYML